MTTKVIQKDMMSPRPEAVKEFRMANDLTQEQSAKLVHGSVRAWQQWESGDRKMPPAVWELYWIKVKTLAAKKEAQETTKKEGLEDDKRQIA